MSRTADRVRPALVHSARPPRSHLQVVPPPRRPRLAFLVVSFLLVGVMVVGVVSVQALVSQSAFRMQELSRRNKQLQEDYGRLKLEVAELSSPDRMAREARRLGYRLPQAVHTLRVKGQVPARGTGTSEEPSFGIKALLEDQP